MTPIGWIIGLLVMGLISQVVLASTREHNASYRAKAIIAQLQRVEFAAANGRMAP